MGFIFDYQNTIQIDPSEPQPDHPDLRCEGLNEFENLIFHESKYFQKQKSGNPKFENLFLSA